MNDEKKEAVGLAIIDILEIEKVDEPDAIDILSNIIGGMCLMSDKPMEAAVLTSNLILQKVMGIIHLKKDL